MDGGGHGPAGRQVGQQGAGDAGRLADGQRVHAGDPALPGQGGRGAAPQRVRQGRMIGQRQGGGQRRLRPAPGPADQVLAVTLDQRHAVQGRQAFQQRVQQAGYQVGGGRVAAGGGSQRGD